MQSVSTSKTVEKLRFVFATHGLPQTIVSDNGPSFTSDEFMQANGIGHITSAPYHPSINGLAGIAEGILGFQKGASFPPQQWVWLLKFKGGYIYIYLHFFFLFFFLF